MSFYSISLRTVFKMVHLLLFSALFVLLFTGRPLSPSVIHTCFPLALTPALLPYSTSRQPTTPACTSPLHLLPTRSSVHLFVYISLLHSLLYLSLHHPLLNTILAPQVTHYPCLCEPTLQGGLGFDYRLVTGPSEMWHWLAESNSLLPGGPREQLQAERADEVEGDWSIKQVILAREDVPVCAIHCSASCCARAFVSL